MAAAPHSPAAVHRERSEKPPARPRRRSPSAGGRQGQPPVLPAPDRQEVVDVTRVQREPETPNRLGMNAKRKSDMAVLMQSKDMMREYAERPFRRPEVRAKGTLDMNEFKEAIYSLLQEFGIQAPPEDKLQKMFEKHRHKGGPGTDGVSLEEYEALLFRLLCFMLATGEVGAVPQRVNVGECRDSNWREMFLRRNMRPIHEVYDFGKKLGSGSFGAVYLVTHRTELKGTTKRECVCKVISKAHANASGLAEEKVREEFAVLKRLDHPHVLRIYEDFEDDQNFYIVMEPCRGGDLENAVKEPITKDPMEWEKWVAKSMKHTLEAIAYCHARGVIHKDLKPENVMLLSPKGAPVENLHVVVVDFGIAEAFRESEARTSTIAGTPPFMAPEVWAGNFGKACDVWAVGVMVFYLLSGRYPFVAETVQDFPRAVAQEPRWQQIHGATPQGQYACWQMLCKSEAGRPTAQHLLQHAWFQQFDMGGSGIQNLSQTMCRGLISVTGRSNFEKFVGRLVATQLDAGQLSKVNEAFKAMDTNHDGMLSRQELTNGLLTLGASADEAARVVDDIDVGRTGRVSYTEFLAGVTDLRQKSPQERDALLWLAWQQFGPDQNGLVRTADIQSALAARGMTVAEMPQAFMQQLRKGASGAMAFDSFKSLFQADESCWLMSSLTGRRALSLLGSGAAAP